jgi:hypothetical protein
VGTAALGCPVARSAAAGFRPRALASFARLDS